MSSEIAIKVESLSKYYQIYSAPRDRLKQFILPRTQRLLGLRIETYHREFWALRNVSFEVEKGETVGIIGRNGSGKSTLLQLICGTLAPSSGNVITQGRIAALLELGSGFNPEFTGRENVYMSCALLGMSKEETEARFSDIASFADIGEFLDRPVKVYSSGMFVRLAFAVNVISSPEIMIVDEALAVGDMNFQAKCMTALKRFQENGGTVLFVSHDVGAVKNLCKQAVYLDNGQIVSAGAAPEVAGLYVRNMREEMNNESNKYSKDSTSNYKSRLATAKVDTSDSNASVLSRVTHPTELQFKSSTQFDKHAIPFRYGMGGAIIRYVELLDSNDQPLVAAEFNQQVKIRIHFEVQEETELSVNYYIQDDNRNLISGAALRTLGHPMLKCAANSRCIATYITKLPLQEGNYSIQTQLTRAVVPDETADFLDVIENAVVFNVARKSTGRLWTKVYLDNEFSVSVV